MGSIFENGFNLPLIVFLVVLIIYFWYAFCIIYHFIRFGVGAKPKILALCFFLGSFFFFAIILILYRQINWDEISQNIF